MNPTLEDFKEKFSKGYIKMTSRYFDTYLAAFKFFYITNNNLQDLDIPQKPSNKQATLIIGQINIDDSLYLAMCQRNFIFILLSSNISLLRNFFQNRFNYITLFLSDDIKQLFIAESIIPSNIYNFDIFEKSNFLSAVESFSNLLNPKNPLSEEIENIWLHTRRIIASFYIFNGYIECNKNRIENIEAKTEEISLENDNCINLPLNVMGSSSSIKLVFHFETQKFFILKSFKFSDADKLMAREEKNYLNIKHPFISRFYGKKIEKYEQYLILEYIKGESLKSISQMKLLYSEKVKIIFEIMIVIEYLHNKNFIYRDLKPNNVIIDKNKTAVLIDYDLMTVNLRYQRNEEMSTDFGNIWMAPEILKGSAKNYSFEVDIYSLGLMIYYIIFEKSPFINMKPSQVQIHFDDFPPEWASLRELCELCTRRNPQERPTIKYMIDKFYFEYYSVIPEQLPENDTIKTVKNIHDLDFVHYWSFLAEKNSYFALNELSKLYQNGNLLARNTEKVKTYYSLSIKHKYNIQDDTLRELYSNFQFLYVDNVKDLMNILKTNFLTFSLSLLPLSQAKVVICFEKNVIIMNSIEINSFIELFGQLKCFCLNVSNCEIDSIPKQDKLVIEEINSFCKHFEQEINENNFLKLTINPVIAYTIRRYLFSSFIFTDNSFFNFDPYNKDDKKITRMALIRILKTIKNNELLKKEFRMLYKSLLIEQADFLSKNDKVNIHKCKKEDFIVLRNLQSDSHFTLDLILHIKKFHVFTLKKYNNLDDLAEEIKFCESCTHECFVPFYGFVEENDKITGIIYEYMNNGTLLDFVNKNKGKIGKIQSFTFIVIIYLTIYYLGKNFPNHQAINLSNIFLNHDNIPFVSYTYYSAPDYNSLESDIKSFGEIIDILFESIDNNSIHKEENPSITFHKSDIKTLNELRDFIFNEIDLPHFSSYYIINNDEQIQMFNAINFIFEMIHIIVYSTNPDKFAQIMVDMHYIANIVSLKVMKNVGEILYQIGLIFDDGITKRKHDYPKAKHYFELSIEKSQNDKALFHLGHLYNFGHGVEQNYLKAKELYEQSSKSNNLFATIYLGILYENGNGIPKDIEKADELFDKAINLKENDSSHVAMGIGRRFYYGFDVEQNYFRAIKYIEISAKKGNKLALFQLAYMYEKGLGFDIDYAKAKENYEKAGSLGVSKAYIKIGNFYFNGQFFKRDINEAKKYYELAIKTNNSENKKDPNDLTDQNDLKDPKAYFKLGWFYYNGLCFVKDKSKGQTYFKKYGDAVSDIVVSFGLYYENGFGVVQNYEKAKEYYELAYDFGNVKAIYQLGVLYKYGNGVEKNISKSNEYFNEYYEKNIKYDTNLIGRDRKDSEEHFFNPESHFNLFEQNNSYIFLNLGKLYEKGYGVKQDYSKAKKYYELAVHHKNVKGYFNLGYLYEKGLGVQQDYLKAKDYYEISAEKNNSKAFYYLGRFYEKGKGVSKNYLKAKDLYERAAEQNNLEAVFQLGFLYLNGKGVDFDIKKSSDYFLKCIKIFNEMKSEELQSKYNIFKYISNTNIGLYYISYSPDFEKGISYLKKAVYDSFPIAQNCYGLCCQFYEKNFSNARYMFEKASKSHFLLASFNMAHLLEANNENANAIQYYIKASDDGDSNLSMKYFSFDFKIEDELFEFEDESLEISMTFISCLTNLKLVIYSLSDSDLSSGKRFFIKSFSKMKKKTPFLQLNPNKKETIIQSLRSFIFNYPDFNLKDNSSNVFLTHREKDDSTVIKVIDRNVDLLNNKEKEISSNESSFSTLQDKSLIDKFLMDDAEFDYYADYDSNLTFETPSDLFDFLRENIQNWDMFNNEIKLIAKDMEDILYEPPYNFLFGRHKNQQSTPKSKALDIEQPFYDGFDGK